MARSTTGSDAVSTVASIAVMDIDTEQLVKDMKVAASDILAVDVSTLRGFEDRQLKAIAIHTKLVAQGIATGGITEETRDFFLDSIEEMTLSFVKTLRGLVMVTIEKTWNAVVKVIWKALEAATGVNINPLP